MDERATFPSLLQAPPETVVGFEAAFAVDPPRFANTVVFPQSTGSQGAFSDVYRGKLGEDVALRVLVGVWWKVSALHPTILERVEISRQSASIVGDDRLVLKGFREPAIHRANSSRARL